MCIHEGALSLQGWATFLPFSLGLWSVGVWLPPLNIYRLASAVSETEVPIAKSGRPAKKVKRIGRQPTVISIPVRARFAPASCAPTRILFILIASRDSPKASDAPLLTSFSPDPAPCRLLLSFAPIPSGAAAAMTSVRENMVVMMWLNLYGFRMKWLPTAIFSCRRRRTFSFNIHYYGYEFVQRSPCRERRYNRLFLRRFWKC